MGRGRDGGEEEACGQRKNQRLEKDLRDERERLRESLKGLRVLRAKGSPECPQES